MNSRSLKLLACLAVTFDLVLWGWILFPSLRSDSGQAVVMYFLDVGQGDSELITIDGVDILVDGGPDAKVLESLSKVMSPTDRYIDLVILSHPHLDHFGGLTDVLKNYDVGVFIDSGHDHTISQYDYFKKVLAEENIKHINLGKGDKVKYKDLVLNFLSPEKTGQKDMHDNTLVFMLEKENFKGLFTGDINFKVEKNLMRDYKDLTANLLKVSHHGSANSASNEWLRAVRPQISVIGVGARNPYGHPKPALLSRLQSSGAQIFRTDQNGTIKAVLEEGNLNISVQKW